MRRILLVASIVALALTGLSCSNSGSIQNETVLIMNDQHSYVARGVSGTAGFEHILGFSGANGASNSTWTFALFRVGGTATPNQEAIKNLWDNFEKEYGPINGRNLSLVNIQYDSEVLNLGLYTSTDIIIHADVVEFKD